MAQKNMTFLPVILLAAAIHVAALPAHAQDGRPYRGLFGSGAGDFEQSLVVNGSIGAGWDNNLAAEARSGSSSSGGLSTSDVDRRFRGGLGTMSGTLAYSLNRSRWSYNASAGSTARYYPTLDSQFVRRDYANTGTSVNLGAGFSAQARASYRPYSLNSLFPTVSDSAASDVESTDEDYVSSTEHYFSYSAGLSYDHQVSRRGTFSASYSYRARESTSEARTFQSHSAGGRYTYALTKNLSARFGYRYSEGLYGGSEPHVGNHNLDVGLNYSRALSFSRRTTFSFGTGTSAVTQRGQEERIRYRATGNAALNHQIGQTWSARLAYNRGLQFSEDWPEPVFSDSITASFGGLVNRRVRLQATARASRGHVGFTEEQKFDNYNASLTATTAISRFINTGVTYSYYRHNFDNDVVLSPGLPSFVDRQSIRAYVSLWAPLFQRSRRP